MEAVDLEGPFLTAEEYIQAEQLRQSMHSQMSISSSPFSGG